MTWAWVGTVWMVVVFVLGAIVAVILLAVVAGVVVATVQATRDGLRQRPVRGPAAPDNVIRIMRSDDK
jgi:hypothetical protein